MEKEQRSKGGLEVEKARAHWSRPMCESGGKFHPCSCDSKCFYFSVVSPALFNTHPPGLFLHLIARHHGNTQTRHPTYSLTLENVFLI